MLLYTYVAVAFFIVWLFFTTLFFWRRHLEPIRSREWIFVMVTNVVGIIHFVYVCAFMDLFSIRGSFSCDLVVWECSFFVPFWSTPYIIRAFLLYFRYSLGDEQVKGGHWFRDHEYLLRWPYLLSFFVLPVLSALLFLLIFQFSFPLPGDYHHMIWCMQNQRIPVLIASVAATPVVAVFAILLMPIKDTFQIKMELGLINAIIPFPMYSWLILEWLELAPIEKWLSILTSIILAFAIMIIWPLWLTYQHQQIQRKVQQGDLNLSSAELMEICFSNEYLYKAFRQFCVESFCVENALFYRQVLEYKACGQAEERLTKAQEICKTYLEEEAHLLVNIFGKNRKEALDKVRAAQKQGEDPGIQVFDNCTKEVFLQMHQDTFPKFKVSKNFQEAWKRSGLAENGSISSSQFPTKLMTLEVHDNP